MKNFALGILILFLGFVLTFGGNMIYIAIAHPAKKGWRPPVAIKSFASNSSKNR